MTSLRRSRFLVSVAALAGLATAVLLGLVAAALLRNGDQGRGAGTAAAYGLAAFGAAGLAVGSLVLARAGAVARRAPWRARALCTRCVLGALVGVVAVLAVGGYAVLQTPSGAPVRGAAVGAVLLAVLVGLGPWQRAAIPAAVRDPGPPAARRRRSGGGGESEPGPAAGAR